MEDQPKGIERLRLEVIADCLKGQGCFNKNGCDHEFMKSEQEDKPSLLAMGITTRTIRTSKCFHKYCDKYKWVIDRADLYAKKLNITRDQIIESWEDHREYWYMNYYQDAHQPDISNPSLNIMLHDDWVNECIKRFGDDPRGWKFKCPRCGHVQSGNDFIAAGIKDWQDCYADCIGRHVKGVGCNWTTLGFLKIHKLSVIKDGTVFPVFELAEAEHENVPTKV